MRNAAVFVSTFLCCSLSPFLTLYFPQFLSVFLHFYTLLQVYISISHFFYISLSYCLSLSFCMSISFFFMNVSFYFSPLFTFCFFPLFISVFLTLPLLLLHFLSIYPFLTISFCATFFLFPSSFLSSLPSHLSLSASLPFSTHLVCYAIQSYVMPC
uniref:Uncharacterized protein n=1 Tax=Rhipicephalus pulchellus TaxID=72859 RepID=L7LYM8_RHIPC